jgi:hypothetical protein
VKLITRNDDPRTERTERTQRTVALGALGVFCIALSVHAAERGAFVTRDPLKAFVYEEYPLGDDYFIRGNQDTVVFRCLLTKKHDQMDGIALSEISIWGKTGPWEVFRRSSDGAFEYVARAGVRDTSCLESCRTKEYLASGKCTWRRGWPK